jgi:hypothetical protein
VACRVGQLALEAEEVEEFRRLKARIAQGRAVEQPEGGPQGGCMPAHTGVQRVAVGGGPAYAWVQLKQGVAWPSGVEPACRETHLSDAEFRVVFQGRSFAEFQQLPVWKQRRMKLEAGLH